MNSNSLLVEPNLDKKTAKITGKVAVGELVSVTIDDVADALTESLRLRVFCAGRVIAQFPSPASEEEAFSVVGDDLVCNMRFDSVEARRICIGRETPVLLVLEDIGDNARLYFTQEWTLKGWPGLDNGVEPVDFSVYAFPTLVREWKEELADAVSKYSGHADRTDNPHGVTASQIGLGKVDNTSDAEKPVSVLTGAAIDAEKRRAEASETALSNDIEAEAGIRHADDQALKSTIEDEIERATAAEYALASSIDNAVAEESGRAKDAEDKIAYDLRKETERAMFAENGNANSIFTETERAVAKENYLEGIIGAVDAKATEEIARAKAAEAGLVKRSGDTMTGRLRFDPMTGDEGVVEVRTESSEAVTSRDFYEYVRLIALKSVTDKHNVADVDVRYQQNGDIALYNQVTRKVNGNSVFATLAISISNAGSRSLIASGFDSVSLPSGDVVKFNGRSLTSIIAAIKTFTVKVVSVLPASGEDKTIYLVPNGGTGTNIKDEYLWVDGNWEKIGTTDVDLSEYLKTKDAVTSVNEKKGDVSLTAADVGALPSTVDEQGVHSVSPTVNLKRATVGEGNISTGGTEGGALAVGRHARCLSANSLAGGHRSMTADGGKYGFAFGNRCYSATGAVAVGYQAWAAKTGSFANDDTDEIVGLSGKSKYSFVWQGKNDLDPGYYHSHGDGTFNINPVGGMSGFWVGELTIPMVIDLSKRYALLIPYGFPRYDSEESRYFEYYVQDFAVNTITVSTDDPIVVNLPAPVVDGAGNPVCRDFVVKIKVLAENPPSITFVKHSSDTSIGFEAADEDWATLELGINYFSFTESER